MADENTETTESAAPETQEQAAPRADSHDETRDVEARIRALEEANARLAKKAAGYEAAEREKEEQQALARGEFDKLRNSMLEQMAAREKMIVSATLDAAIAAAGVADDDIADLMRAGLAQHATFDPETGAVTGDYQRRAKALAKKLQPAPEIKKQVVAPPPSGSAKAGPAENVDWRAELRRRAMEG